MRGQFAGDQRNGPSHLSVIMSIGRGAGLTVSRCGGCRRLASAFPLSWISRKDDEKTALGEYPFRLKYICICTMSHVPLLSSARPGPASSTPPLALLQESLWQQGHFSLVGLSTHSGTRSERPEFGGGLKIQPDSQTHPMSLPTPSKSNRDLSNYLLTWTGEDQVSVFQRLSGSALW